MNLVRVCMNQASQPMNTRRRPANVPFMMTCAALVGVVLATCLKDSSRSSALASDASPSVRARSAIFVAIPPGCTQVTVSEVPRYSACSDSVKPRTANFALL